MVGGVLATLTEGEATNQANAVFRLSLTKRAFRLAHFVEIPHVLGQLQRVLFRNTFPLLFILAIDWELFCETGLQLFDFGLYNHELGRSHLTSKFGELVDVEVGLIVLNFVVDRCQKDELQFSQRLLLDLRYLFF